MDPLTSFLSYLLESAGAGLVGSGATQVLKSAITAPSRAIRERIARGRPDDNHDVENALIDSLVETHEILIRMCRRRQSRWANRLGFRGWIDPLQKRLTDRASCKQWVESQFGAGDDRALLSDKDLTTLGGMQPPTAQLHAAIAAHVHALVAETELHPAAWFTTLVDNGWREHGQHADPVTLGQLFALQFRQKIKHRPQVSAILVMDALADLRERAAAGESGLSAESIQSIAAALTPDLFRQRILDVLGAQLGELPQRLDTLHGELTRQGRVLDDSSGVLLTLASFQRTSHRQLMRQLSDLHAKADTNHNIQAEVHQHTQRIMALLESAALGAPGSTLTRLLERSAAVALGALIVAFAGWALSLLYQAYQLETGARCSGTRLCILVTRLQLDEDGRQTRHILHSLRGIFPPDDQGSVAVEVIAADRVIGHQQLNDWSSLDSSAQQQALALMARRKADVLIYGEMRAPDQLLNLRLLSAEPSADASMSSGHNFGVDNKSLTLSTNFNESLGAAVAAFAVSGARSAYASGVFLAETVKPLAERLERLVGGGPCQLGDRACAALFQSYAIVNHYIGAQSGDSAALAKSIDAYKQALTYADQIVDSSLWATTQNNLGIALLSLGERESGTQRLLEAVAAFRAALLERTRDRVPFAWATTQYNLGIALQTLGERESGTQHLLEAVEAYRAALQERTRDRVPLNWAATQNNLGIALQTLGEREFSTERLLRAVEAYRAALQERTRDRVPLDWAATQNNLGTALATLGEREFSTERMLEAVEAYRAALQERTQDRVPRDWAMTQNNLGIALQTLGERESGTERLLEAVEAYRAALQERTRDRVPLEWAATQDNLGSALKTLGERESSTERLLEALEAHRAALQEHTRDRVPLDWAATQNNLGNALQTLGERESGTERMLEAVESYRAALQERTRDRVPRDWAGTQNNLGIALTTLGERESGTERLREAVEAYRAALQEQPRDRIPLDWATTQYNLGIALKTLGAREAGTERLLEAVEAYRAALQERSRDRVPLDWAATQYNLGIALRTLGARESGTQRLLEAVEAYRAALQEYSRDRVPLYWVMTQNNLGIALKTLGERESDDELVLEAVVALGAALEVAQEAKAEYDISLISRNLKRAEAALDQMRKDGGL